MANELLTRDDIVRAKQNVDAYDKYLDGGAEETVKLPSGNIIKTRAGVEKELMDKFPDDKAGLRNVGTNIGEVIVMTPTGVGLTGLGSTRPNSPYPDAVSLLDYRINGYYAIDYGTSSKYEDTPPGAGAGVLQVTAYNSSSFISQTYRSLLSNRLWVRSAKDLNTETPTISEWGELYQSANDRPYRETTATQPNLVVEPTGELRRSTSSRVFKDNIQPLEVENYREALRMFEPVSYNSKHTADNPEWVWYSFIAEDLAEVDPSLVQLSPIEFYEDTDEDGNTFVNNRQLPEGEYAPVGLNFNGIITMLTRINQHMLDDIEDLEKDKTQLKTRMTKLENRLAELEKLLPAS